MKWMLRLLMHLLLLALLVGCARSAASPTSAADCVDPAADELCPAVPGGTAAQGEPVGPDNTLLPEEVGPAVTAALPSLPEGVVPYSDCARAPVLAGCAAQPALDGRLAFAESAPARVVGLDLRGGQGWQAALEGSPGWLAWSPDGAPSDGAPPDGVQLLVAEQSDLGEQYVLFGADGTLLERFTADIPPTWQPDGSLSRDGRLRSAQGWEAELAQTDDFRQALRYRPPDGQWSRLLLEGESPDALFSLRAWLPGTPQEADTPRLLLQSYLGGNAALLFGGDLLLADLEAGTLASLEISAPLDASAFAWNPAEPAQLALVTSGAPDGTRRLALYNFDTGKLRYPLPEGVIVAELSWQPDGELLAFSTGELAGNASAEARKVFSAPGIYLLEAQSGDVTALPQPPPGAQDGWPQWAAADTLVYGRALPLRSGEPGLQVRARRLADGRDWLLVDGLPAPPTAAGRIFWDRALAFVSQE